MKPSTENGKRGAWIRGVWHPTDYSCETYIPKDIKEKWFVSTPTDGFTLYDSESQAHEAFLKAISVERDYCYEDGEWNFEVEDICWGKVYQDVVLRKVPSPYNEDIDPDDPDYDTEECYDAFANERRLII